MSEYLGYIQWYVSQIWKDRFQSLGQILKICISHIVPVMLIISLKFHENLVSSYQNCRGIHHKLGQIDFSTMGRWPCDQAEGDNSHEMSKLFFFWGKKKLKMTSEMFT